MFDRTGFSTWKITALVLAVCAGIVAARMSLVLAPGVHDAAPDPVMNLPARRQAEWRRVLGRYPVRDLEVPEIERKRRRKELLAVDPRDLPPAYRYAFLFTRMTMAASDEIGPEELDAIRQRLMQTPRPTSDAVAPRHREDLLDADLLYEMAGMTASGTLPPDLGGDPDKTRRARLRSAEILRYVVENFPADYLAVARARWLLYHINLQDYAPRDRIDMLWKLAAIDPERVFSVERFDRTRLEVVSAEEHLERHIREVNPRNALLGIFSLARFELEQKDAIRQVERLLENPYVDRSLRASIGRWLSEQGHPATAREAIEGYSE